MTPLISVCRNKNAEDYKAPNKREDLYERSFA